MLSDELKLYEENKKLKKELNKVKKGFHNLEWEYGTLLEFIDKQGLTEKAAHYVAECFMTSVLKGEITDNNNDSGGGDDKVDAVA